VATEVTSATAATALAATDILVGYTPGTPNVAKRFSGAVARASAEVWVHEAATGGAGTSGSPWTGWDTAITWAAHTRYRLKAGWYSYATSPNFGLVGLELVADPGAYLKHTGTGNALTFDAGSGEGTDWTQGLRVEGVQVYGTQTALTGTVAETNGSATVTGTGTAFLSQVAVGDSITFIGGTSNARSYLVSAVTDDLTLTIDRTATATSSGTATVTKTRHGFYLRGVRNSAFDRCRAHDVGYAAIHTEACVTNSLRLFRVTDNTASDGEAYNCRPQYGLVFTGRGADWSTCWNVEESVVEGVQRYGVWVKTDAYGHTFLNGTSEGHPAPAVAVQIDVPQNTFVMYDVEANASGSDFVVNSNRNVLLNCLSTATTTVTASGNHNVIQAGYYQNVTVNATAFRNRLLVPTVNGTLTDNGNLTLYDALSTTDVRSSLGIPRPVVKAITAGGSMATDAALGNYFAVDATGTNCTLNAPTNGVAGMRILYRFVNGGGVSQSITWNAAFAGNTGAALPATVDAGKWLFVEFVYETYGSNVWRCLNVVGN
jgi:hypothetical protein